MKRGPRSIEPRSEPTLSLCMIVKNEAGSLERCLASARPYVDEIVVVDTGSTDETLEIARRYADVLDEIDWPGSFSVARNHSLDLASGEYLLILDGDEYLEGEEQWQKLKQAMRGSRVIGLRIPVLNLLPEGELVQADRIWQERVFLNHPKLRYTGKVHNQIQRSIIELMERTQRTLVEVDSEVVHTGYALTKDQMQSKYRPRLELLHHEYENPIDEKHRAYYTYQLGLVYYVLQEYRTALDLFNEIDFTNMIDLNAFYTHMLAVQTALKLQDVPAALVHADGMLTRNRQEPVAYVLTGYALLGAKEIVNGLMMMVEAFNIKMENGRRARFVLNEQKCMELFASMCEKVGLRQHAAGFRHFEKVGTDEPAKVRALIEALKLALVQHEMGEAA